MSQDNIMAPISGGVAYEVTTEVKDLTGLIRTYSTCVHFFALLTKSAPALPARKVLLGGIATFGN